MLRLFKGTCEAVRAMHNFHAPLKKANSASSKPNNQPSPEPQRNSDDEPRDMFPQPEGDDEGGFSYDGPVQSGPSVPLMSRRMREESNDVIFDGDQDLPDGNGNGVATGETELVPYAHRDIKPG